MVAALAVAVLPHAGRLPLWVVALAAGAAAWRLWADRRGLGVPPRGARLLLTLAAIGGAAAHYGTLIGLEAGSALLAALVGLKLVEVRSRRDARTVILGAYFLLAAQALFRSDLPMALYLAAALGMVTAAWLTAERETAAGGLLSHARDAAALLGQALPLAAVLFLLFPRLPGPLWGLPDSSDSGVTGLSEHMEPGAISSLARSDAVAFRITFDGGAPPPGQRYFRGPVLTAFDGHRWSREEPNSSRPRARYPAPGVRHTVTLQPHHRRWLFALDRPRTAPSRAALAADGSLIAEEPVRELRRYTVVSHLRARLDAGQRPPPALTALAPGAHPRARALAARWRHAAGDDAGVVARALAHFREQDFTYTLSPPPLPERPVDRFLFDTRAGFCGHFASALAVLLRAADVPARVVTGYLGAERHPEQDYWVVRQSHAHAWVEAWLPGKGWQRLDPTVAAAPGRTSDGLGRSVAAGDPVPLMARPGGGWLKELRWRWEALEVAWNRWVLAYDASRQDSLLGRLGLGDWRWRVGALALGGLLAVGLVALWVLGRPRGKARDPIRRQWDRVGRRLQRLGLGPHTGEGPRDYALRVAAARPDLAEAVQGLAARYVALRYAERDSRATRRDFRRAVRRFRPKPWRGRPAARRAPRSD
jgi:transglutaminase-like putative cysteine protease